jgi:hypothetical protein
VIFRFPFSTAPTTQAAMVECASNPAYIWEYGIDRYSKPVEVLPGGVVDLEGYEIMGPFDAMGIRRIPISRVYPVVDGTNVGGDNVSPNEHMLPILGEMTTNDQYPFRDGMACTNLGKSMLMGGSPAETPVRIGPGQNLNFRVEFPTIGQGGDAVINTDMFIKAHLAYANDGVAMLNALKNSPNDEVKTAAAAGNFVQRQVVGDIENIDTILPQEVVRTIPANVDEWSSLNMGTNADDPQIKRVMIYAKNAQPTTPNQEMELVREGSFVQMPFQNMRWTASAKKLYQFTHAGYIPHPNSHQIKFGKEKSRYPQIFNSEIGDNAFVMPNQRLLTARRYVGPTPIARPYILMDDIGSIKVTDNGVSIPAWAAGVRGLEIGLWGYEYSLK